MKPFNKTRLNGAVAAALLAFLLPLSGSAKDFGYSYEAPFEYTEPSGDNTFSTMVVDYDNWSDTAHMKLTAENGSNRGSWIRAAFFSSNAPDPRATFRASLDNRLGGTAEEPDAASGNIDVYGPVNVLLDAGRDNVVGSRYYGGNAIFLSRGASLTLKAGRDNHVNSLKHRTAKNTLTITGSSTLTLDAGHNNYVTGTYLSIVPLEFYGGHGGGTLNIFAGNDNVFRDVPACQNDAEELVSASEGAAVHIKAGHDNVLEYAKASGINASYDYTTSGSGLVTVEAGNDNRIHASEAALSNEGTLILRAGNSNWAEADHYAALSISTKGSDRVADTLIAAERGDNTFITHASAGEYSGPSSALSVSSRARRGQNPGITLITAGGTNRFLAEGEGSIAASVGMAGDLTILGNDNLFSGNRGALYVGRADTEVDIRAAGASTFLSEKGGGVVVDALDTYPYNGMEWDLYYVGKVRIASGADNTVSAGIDGVLVNATGAASLSAGGGNIITGRERYGAASRGVFEDRVEEAIDSPNQRNGDSAVNLYAAQSNAVTGGRIGVLSEGSARLILRKTKDAVQNESGEWETVDVYLLESNGAQKHAAITGLKASSLVNVEAEGSNTLAGSEYGVRSLASKVVVPIGRDDDINFTPLEEWDYDASRDKRLLIYNEAYYDDPEHEPYLVEAGIPEFNGHAKSAVRVVSHGGDNVITGKTAAVSSEGYGSGEYGSSEVTVTAESGRNVITGTQAALLASRHGSITVNGSSVIQAEAAVSSSGKLASVTVNYGKDSVINGRVLAADEGYVSIAPADGDLLFIGSADTNRTGAVHLNLSSGSVWQMKSSSRVTTLSGSGSVIFANGGQSLEAERLSGSHTIAMDLSTNGAESDMLYVGEGTSEKQTLFVKNMDSLMNSMREGEAVRFATIRNSRGEFAEGLASVRADGPVNQALAVEYRSVSSDPLNTAEYNDAYNGDGTDKPTTAQVAAIYGSSDSAKNVYLVMKESPSDGSATAGQAGRMIWRYATDMDTYTRRNSQSTAFAPDTNSGLWLRAAYKRQDDSDTGCLHGPFWELGFSGDAASNARYTHRVGISFGHAVMSGGWDKENGSAHLKDTSAAFYYTRLGSKNEWGVAQSYWDNVLRYHHLRSELTTNDRLSLAAYKDHRTQEAVTTSTEYGQRLFITDTVTITPQAQFQLGYVGGFDATDNQSMRTSAGHDWSAIARLGFDLTNNWGAQKESTMYFKASVLHEFADGQEIRVEGGSRSARFVHDGSARGTWVSLGAGLNCRLGSQASVYFDGETELGNGYRNSYVFTGGLKYVF